ncbi:Uncharacterized protein DBV15_03522 [Temnothorax longispinosus]|uniref:Uncharacterized protein n=1 Tax=Temnothorax longispinosus TaxID=300112 RepID=A0A4S2KUG9_9HYME|nr:Uncharacterized protein DBV15_03522 [Temnothorax longispinosus]
MGTQEGAGAVWDNMTKIGRHETIEGESMDRHRKARQPLRAIVDETVKNVDVFINDKNTWVRS